VTGIAFELLMYHKAKRIALLEGVLRVVNTEQCVVLLVGAKVSDCLLISIFLRKLSHIPENSAPCSYYHKDRSSQIVILQGKPAKSNCRRFFEPCVKKAKLLILLYPKNGGDMFYEKSVPSANYTTSYLFARHFATVLKIFIFMCLP
jgi:hypothetical protein